MQQPTEICPGCGVQLEHTALHAPPPRYAASGSCWLVFGELSYYTLSLNDPYFIHQLTIDAYGAQHSGQQTKPITTVFALVGLQLAIEKRYTGRQVQQAHIALARQQKDWPTLIMPDQTGAITMQDVWQAEAGQHRNRRIHDWTESVWQRWAPSADWVRDCVNRYGL
ncbi:DUF5946 family protein [Fibrella aquatilis]|uniref:Uncharacterized protein n=1 Tax=Fibrella aquatilis TaxID=2817059 RepID=A0A939G649_9BACT|nr:DUF5946 family protein [Fibrella aquatilis]MBO0931304.1 hypothetical protein [Fibrella aquatilis]